jgi:hypothetical protein
VVAKFDCGSPTGWKRTDSGRMLCTWSNSWNGSPVRIYATAERNTKSP